MDKIEEDLRLVLLRGWEEELWASYMHRNFYINSIGYLQRNHSDLRLQPKSQVNHRTRDQRYACNAQDKETSDD